MWTYEQTTGKLYDNSGAVVGIGYSGCPACKNDPASENLVDQGPIVHGMYTIVGPPFDSNQHGKYCLKLVPDDDTVRLIVSYGRDPWSFLIHGDRINAPGTASEGCIIMDRGTRERIGNGLAVDKDLKVVAQIVYSDVDSEIAT